MGLLRFASVVAFAGWLAAVDVTLAVFHTAGWITARLDALAVVLHRFAAGHVGARLRLAFVGWVFVAHVVVRVRRRLDSEEDE
jgi:hypothetical protein